MNINDAIISGIQEIIYFDVWESFLMIIAFVICMNLKTNKYYIIFHSFMLSILDYLIMNLINVPILQQIISILFCCLYFIFVFHTSIKTTIIRTIQIFFAFFVIEMMLSMMYQYILNIYLIILSNNLKKFIYMIPFRIIEFILIYIYYKLRINRKSKEVNRI